MTIFDSFAMALRSIKANKTRAGLTMLGVVIGIASVIILVAIGEAAKQYVVNQMQSFGMKTTLMQITPGKDSGDYMAFLNNKIRYKHAVLLREKCPSVSELVPIIAGKGESKYGNKKYRVRQIWGVTDAYQNIFNHKLLGGRFFSKGEVEGNKKVCVLGSTVVDKLFGSFSPLGEKIKINGRKFTVIGVFEKKGKIMMQDMDDVIAMPITTSMQLLDTKGVVEIDVIAKTDDVIPKAMKVIHAVMLKDLTEED